MENRLELMRSSEIPTCCLRGNCSTTELHQHVVRVRRFELLVS